MPPALGWAVLTLLLLVEVAAVVAVGVAGAHAGGWLAATCAVLVAVAAWWAFASPKAPFGAPVVRTLVKVLVFGAACAGLWWSGHTAAAVVLLVVTVAVHAAAAHPDVARLAREV